MITRGRNLSGVARAARKIAKSKRKAERSGKQKKKDRIRELAPQTARKELQLEKDVLQRRQAQRNSRASGETRPKAKPKPKPVVQAEAGVKREFDDKDDPTKKLLELVRDMVAKSKFETSVLANRSKLVQQTMKELEQKQKSTNGAMLKRLEIQVAGARQALREARRLIKSQVSAGNDKHDVDVEKGNDKHDFDDELAPEIQVETPIVASVKLPEGGSVVNLPDRWVFNNSMVNFLNVPL